MLTVLFFLLPALFADFSDLVKPIESIFPSQISLEHITEKPSLSVVIDAFAARKDFSEEILASMPSSVILSLASHMVVHPDMIKKAADAGFSVAISIDFLNIDQWLNLQKLILQINTDLKEKYKSAGLKGLIIWRVTDTEDFKQIMSDIKNWLSSQNMWVLYANAHNMFAPQNVPPGVLLADGFVLPDEKKERVGDVASFVLNQAYFNGKGIVLIKPGRQHLNALKDWLHNHQDSFVLENFRK